MYASLHVRVGNKGAFHLYTDTLGYQCAPAPSAPGPFCFPQLPLVNANGVEQFSAGHRTLVPATYQPNHKRHQDLGLLLILTAQLDRSQYADSRAPPVCLIWHFAHKEK